MAYSFARMTSEHEGAVLRLWQDNMAGLGNGAVLTDRLRWLYRDNPAGPTDTVVALSDADEVVGCASAFPRNYYLRGTPLRAGVPVDFAVSRKHRTAAAALGLQRALVGPQSTFDFLCGFPNRAALPVLQRVGFKPFAAACAWIKPLRANYKIEPVLKNLYATAAVAALPNAWLRASDAQRARRERLSGEFAARADERFDSLWARASRHYAVVGERTAAHLNWRYAAFPGGAYEFFLATQPGKSELVGYVAFQRRAGKVFIGDLFAIDMEESAERVLLEFGRHLRDHGADSIFVGYAGNEGFERRLQRLGYIRRALGPRSMVGLPRTTDPEQSKLLVDRDHWFLFDGEMDI
jgi:hypothetical protein